MLNPYKINNNGGLLESLKIFFLPGFSPVALHQILKMPNSKINIRDYTISIGAEILKISAYVSSALLVYEKSEYFF